MTSTPNRMIQSTTLEFKKKIVLRLLGCLKVLVVFICMSMPESNFCGYQLSPKIVQAMGLQGPSETLEVAVLNYMHKGRLHQIPLPPMPLANHVPSVSEAGRGKSSEEPGFPALVIYCHVEMQAAWCQIFPFFQEKLNV